MVKYDFVLTTMNEESARYVIVICADIVAAMNTCLEYKAHCVRKNDHHYFIAVSSAQIKWCNKRRLP